MSFGEEQAGSLLGVSPVPPSGEKNNLFANAATLALQPGFWYHSVYVKVLTGEGRRLDALLR